MTGKVLVPDEVFPSPTRVAQKEREAAGKTVYKSHGVHGLFAVV